MLALNESVNFILMFIEQYYRVLIFLSLLLLLPLVEYFFPLRVMRGSIQRWLKHLSILALSQLLIRVVLPFTLVGLAFNFQQYQWGLFNYLQLNHGVVSIVVSVIIFDLLIYLQHVCSHHWKWLWRMHRVHHSDPCLDFSTALRFHPLEMILSYLYKALCIISFGFSVESVIVFEILLSSLALFNHANLRLARVVERWLRKLIVTPDMHTVHHSQNKHESDSNFGFCLSCWDYMFRTYIASPADDFSLGQQGESNASAQTLKTLLVKPFKAL